MKTAVLLLLLCIPTASYADPSSYVKELMNEPVSMLDFGLYQLEKELQEWFSNTRHADYYIHAYYNYTLNRITISSQIVLLDEEAQKRATPKQWCVINDNY
jgi:hypothetical protein